MWVAELAEAPIIALSAVDLSGCQLSESLSVSMDFLLYVCR